MSLVRGRPALQPTAPLPWTGQQPRARGIVRTRPAAEPAPARTTGIDIGAMVPVAAAAPKPAVPRVAVPVKKVPEPRMPEPRMAETKGVDAPRAVESKAVAPEKALANRYVDFAMADKDNWKSVSRAMRNRNAQSPEHGYYSSTRQDGSRATSATAKNFDTALKNVKKKLKDFGFVMDLQNATMFPMTEVLRGEGRGKKRVRRISNKYYRSGHY